MMCGNTWQGIGGLHLEGSGRRSLNLLHCSWLSHVSCFVLHSPVPQDRMGRMGLPTKWS